MAAGGKTVERMEKRFTSVANSVVLKRSMSTSDAPARRPNRTL